MQLDVVIFIVKTIYEILCNACIWGHAESKTLTSIQLNALRFALGVGKACPIAGLFGESGWVPYSMMVKFNILRFRTHKQAAPTMPML